MKRTLWTERVFTFDLPDGWIFNILERLRGTPIRLEHMTQDLSRKVLTEKPGDKYSILEHIGHLADLEELHLGRLEDFRNGKEVLRAADMQNVKTSQAGHNQKDLAYLLHNFENLREQFIRNLSAMDDATLRFRSLHPRLQVMVRPMDMGYFAAEHDDHHLAYIRELS